MAKVIRFWNVILLCCLAFACEKTDPELLWGDIAGLVEVYDENYFLLEDMAGVQIHLSNGTLEEQTATDPSGRFLFEHIDYGNYMIDMDLEGFYLSQREYPVHHLGGYSPTLVNYRIHEIPKFETRIDSIQYNGYYQSTYIYVTLSELSGLPRLFYSFVCFFSNTPDVSKDLFIADDVGWIWNDEFNGQQAEIQVEIYDNRFEPLESDSIYCSVYPRSMNNGYYDYDPEGFGKTSNVFGFVAH